MTFLPTAPPPTLRLQDRAFFRISRMGGSRQLLFTPLVVAKFARGVRNRAMLSREIRNLSAAKHADFWKPLVPRCFGFGLVALMTARYSNVGLQDYAPLSALVEQRLDGSLTRPRAPAVGMVEESAVLASLDGDARARALEALSALALPVTGMHGDFHMYNFCKTAAGGFVLVDWEHFDAAGSFALDYLEFHTANRCFSELPKWDAFLEARSGPDKSAFGAAKKLGCDPQALWLLYLLVKLDTLAQRRGGLANMPSDNSSRFGDLVRRQIEATSPVFD